MTSSRTGRRSRSLDDAETLRLFASRLPEGLYISDAAGRILDANPAFLDIVGVDSLAALGATGLAGLCDGTEGVRAWAARLERDGLVRGFECELVRPDGERRTVLLTAFVVASETGERLHHGLLIDVTERKRLENDLRESLVRDPLTGCYNRRYLAGLSARLGESAENRWGCIFIDIDHFKLLNDQFGHLNGDRTLQEMARFLMREVRTGEPVIRLGGDEFLIVLAGDGSGGTEDVARRLQVTAIRSAPVPFSLGWALRDGSEPLEATIDRADRRLIGVRVVHRSGDHPSLSGERERRHGDGEPEPSVTPGADVPRVDASVTPTERSG